MKLDTKNSKNIVKKWFFVVFQKFLNQPEGALYILFVLSKRCSKKMRKRKPVPKCDFNKVGKQLLWIYISAWVFFWEVCSWAFNIIRRKRF